MSEVNPELPRKLTEQELADMKLSVNIAKEAAFLANIPDSSTYTQPPFQGRWRVFVEQYEWNVFLLFEGNSIVGAFEFRTSLDTTAYEIFHQISSLLKNSKARELLDVSEDESRDIAKERCVDLIRTYVTHLPNVVFHSFHQALKETLINQIKKFIEPDLREHWQKLGLPKNFSLIAEDNFSNFSKLFPDADLLFIKVLDEIDNNFVDYRKKAFGSRKVWLDDNAMSKLPEQYDKLKSEYKVAKQFYDNSRELFFKNNRNAKLEDWEKVWQTQSEQFFPELFCLDKVLDYDSHELAKLHLANLFDYSLDGMVKKISEARKLIEDNNNENKIENTDK